MLPPALNVPEQFLRERAAAGFDRIEYGVGGIVLLDSARLAEGQIGYSVTPEGTTLIGGGDGDWHSDWLVIGCESACGDPIFMSVIPPYPVFTAMHGQGSWDPKLVAPSIDVFWECLRRFRHFAEARSYPVQLEANPPSHDEITTYLQDVGRLCNGNADAVDFWLVQGEIGMESDEP
jgi:hypothetical protein